MFKIVGLKVRKPRQFEYKPRFFDAEAEAREERRRELCEQTGDSEEHVSKSEQYHPGQYIRKNMYARRGMGSSREKGDQRAKMMRVAVFVAIAIILLVFIFS